MPDNTPDRQAIRDELNATRTAYHELLDSLSESDWKTKSANPAWSVGQLMWHLGYGMEFFPKNIEYCRKGSGPNPPSFLVGPGNVLLTRWGSRGAKPESVAKKYDAAHDDLLASLDSIQDDEWTKTARVYGNDYTIESTFREVAVHFREHESDILHGLDRL
jgi:DinB superfamily